MEMKRIRVEKLKSFIESHAGASNVAKKYDGIDASYISQLLNYHRPFGKKSARNIEELCKLPIYYFDSLESKNDLPQKINEEIYLENNPDYPAIRRVNIKLSAGISGFAIDFDVEDKTPLVKHKDWFESRGYNPSKLLATKVIGESMEPTIKYGDLVVINTAENTPLDGVVFAVNYEGELLIKRLMRDAGNWWLTSDNADQRIYPRKQCEGDMCIILGKIVEVQTEII